MTILEKTTKACCLVSISVSALAAAVYFASEAFGTFVGLVVSLAQMLARL